MERKDIIRLAMQAGFMSREDSSAIYASCEFDKEICCEEYAYGEIVERFTKLVEAAVREKVVAEMTDAANEACQRAMEFEREECAKLCDGIVAQYGEDVLVAWFAEDIRARGQG